jgi:hypothetical protein
VTETVPESESDATILCKSCGLCCNGYLFSSITLDNSEIESSKTIGFHVIQSGPEKATASQPCPFWTGVCKIYLHPNKPSICSVFKCKLLKEVEGGELKLVDALDIVQLTKGKIHELEKSMSRKENGSFLDRLGDQVFRIKHLSLEEGNRFRLKAGTLLVIFKQRFGVTYFTNQSEMK